MARLIDADALKDTLGVSDSDIEFAEMLDEAPTIEAEPVRHGKWIHKGGGIFTCDKCSGYIGLNVYTREKASERFKWCPRCGARMDEERKEE